ncbi:MAG: flagellar type III secretion system pore protein FliP [bacterium]|nr:flagellar type III secretion system pore protein FliP [bacterium]
MSVSDLPLRKWFSCRTITYWLFGLFLFAAPLAFAQTTVLPKFTVGVERAKDAGDLSVTLQILLLMTVLSIAPSILVMMTSFTRILIVFHFLRQAMGTPQMPPNQIIIGLALFVTFFIMNPTMDRIYKDAWVPYKEKRISTTESYEKAVVPLREFMLKNTREKDLQTFVKLDRSPQPQTAGDLPMRIIIPAFVISELRVAFQIGFLLYLPFLVIDMVISSVLMSMGMMMLPPVMISLPFKVLLFVLVDGWNLIITSLVQSFH